MTPLCKILTPIFHAMTSSPWQLPRMTPLCTVLPRMTPLYSSWPDQSQSPIQLVVCSPNPCTVLTNQIHSFRTTAQPQLSPTFHSLLMSASTTHLYKRRLSSPVHYWQAVTEPPTHTYTHTHIQTFTQTFLHFIHIYILLSWITTFILFTFHTPVTCWSSNFILNLALSPTLTCQAYLGGSCFWYIEGQSLQLHPSPSPFSKRLFTSTFESYTVVELLFGGGELELWGEIDN